MLLLARVRRHVAALLQIRLAHRRPVGGFMFKQLIVCSECLLRIISVTSCSAFCSQRKIHIVIDFFLLCVFSVSSCPSFRRCLLFFLACTSIQLNYDNGASKLS